MVDMELRCNVTEIEMPKLGLNLAPPADART